MDIEWHTVATHLIKALDFHIQSLECVKRSKDEETAQKYSYDIIDGVRKDPNDWDEGLVRSSATHLLFSVVPTHLCACYRLKSNGLSYEASVLLRSLSEVLDLIEFFNHPRCTRQTLEKWVRGEIVANRITREEATSFALGGDEYVIADEFRDIPEAQNITKLLRAKLYSARSRAVHHASDAVMQAARNRRVSSSDSDSDLADFNGELIRSCDYFLDYFGDALPNEHKKAFHDLTRLLKGTLDDYVPKLIPKIIVTPDPVLSSADDESLPR